MKWFTVGLMGMLLAGGGRSVEAQVVHLPALQYFTVQTSVLAPDRGGTSLGRVRRSSRGRTSLGTPGMGKIPGWGRLFGNRAIGGSDSHTGRPGGDSPPTTKGV